MSAERGVSVVIPTVDREAMLERSLTAIARAAGAVDEPVEAIVVDDSEAAARHRPTAWDLLGLPVRRLYTADAGVKGPPAARNLGVAAARYDVVEFTDDDTRCDPGWLASGVRRLRKDPALAGVEGAVRIDLDQPIDPVRSRIVVNLRGGGYLTASLFARTDAVRAVGGFRRLRDDGQGWATIAYREDTDLGLRLIDRVGAVPFEPSAFVWHPAEPVDLRELVKLARYFVVDGAFARLHPGAIPPVLERPLARLRIRLASALTLLTPGLLPKRTRRPAVVGIATLAAAVSAQFEFELRAAGVRRGPFAIARDTVRRVPRTLVWAVAAGSARLQSEAIVDLGFAKLPE